MSKKNKKKRQIGKNIPQKKHWIDPKYQNTFWTTIVLVILIIFFIINNTKKVPNQGPYPPDYKAQTTNTINPSN